MPEVSERSSSSSPSPGPVSAVTVHVASDPVTPVIDAPATALPDSEKLAADTPVTGSENVTVHDTLDAFVGFGSAGVTDNTVGGVLSLCGVLPHDVAAGAPANRAAIHARTSDFDAESGRWTSSYQRSSTMARWSHSRCTKGGNNAGSTTSSRRPCTYSIGAAGPLIVIELRSS